MVGVALGGYLTLLLLTSLPVVQQWTARRGAALLSDVLGTDVRVGNIRLGLFNRIVADDVLLFDQRSDTLLAAARLSAKVDITALASGQVRIANVQLHGYDIRLRRHSPDEPYTFQFIVDSLASRDTTTHTPLDLAINSVIIRRGSIRHDLTWQPRQQGLDINHTELHDFSLKASLHVLTDDSINVDVSRLSFTESRSRLTLTDLDFHFEGGRRNCLLDDFVLCMPESELHIDSLCADYELPTSGTPLADWLNEVTASAGIAARLTPRDVSPLLPMLSRLNLPLDFTANARLADGTLTISDATANADGFVLDASGDIRMSKPLCARTDIRRLSLSEATSHVVIDMLSSSDTPLLSPTLAQTLERIGAIEAKATAAYTPTLTEAEADIRTSIGDLTAHATLTDGAALNARLTTTDLRLAHLLGDEGPTPFADMLTLNAEAEGNIRAGTIQGTVQATGISVKGSRIDDVRLKADLSPAAMKADLHVEDDEYAFSLIANLSSDGKMGLTPDELLRLRGFVVLSDLRISTKEHNYHLNDLTLHNYADEAGQHIELNGDFIDAHIDGNFSPKTLVQASQNMLHTVLPSLIPEAKSVNNEAPKDEISFTAQLWNTDPLLKLTDVDLRLPEPGTLRGHLRADERRMELNANFARIDYGSERLTGVNISVDGRGDSIGVGVNLARQMESGPVRLALWANARADSLRTLLGWDNGRQPAMNGRLDASTLFSRDANGLLDIDIALRPTRINVQDTIWDIRPARIALHDGAVKVRGVEVAQAHRHLRVDGTASKNPADTLRAHLQDIPLEYVFDMINFDEVSFKGQATGYVTARSLMVSPVVDADLSVPNLIMNGGLMGSLHMRGGWGREGPRTIDLD